MFLNTEAPSVHLSRQNFILRRIAIKMANHKNIQTLAIETYKVKNSLAPEIVSNIFCLQKQCQYDLRQQTDSKIPSVRSLYHSSESILYRGPKTIRNWIPKKCPSKVFLLCVNLNFNQ